MHWNEGLGPLKPELETSGQARTCNLERLFMRDPKIQKKSAATLASEETYAAQRRSFSEFLGLNHR